jgi:hypothetical protein
MANKIFAALFVLASASTCLPKVLRDSLQLDPFWDTDLPIRERINEHYPLSSGALVTVSFISGSVDVETADIAAAEVSIVRSARSKADLEFHKVTIEHSPLALVLRGELADDRFRPEGIEVRQRITLRVPRQTLLSINNISGSARISGANAPVLIKNVSGSVTIGNVSTSVEVDSVSRSVTLGNVNGAATLSKVSGSVTVRKLEGSLTASDVSGGLSMMIAQLDEGGVRANRINGSVELRFRDALNADFGARHLSGQVYFEVPYRAISGDTHGPDFNAKIGDGGPPIFVSNISGVVRLKRASL